MKSRFVLTVLTLAFAGVVAGCGGDTKIDAGGGPSTAATTSTQEPATEAPVTECLHTGQPPATKKDQYSKAEQVLKEGVEYTIVMKTSCGPINIKLDPKAGGPIPNSIAFLTSKGFYDNLIFHRVVPDFVLQGGDPTGTGGGGPGYEVVGPVPSGYQYQLGDVAMAKTSQAPAGASGSQFFVVSSANGGAGLTQQPVYGILGHAKDPESLGTIARIAALGVSDGPPSKPVWIIEASVEPAVS